MKRKLSLVLALCVIVTMFSGFNVFAVAESATTAVGNVNLFLNGNCEDTTIIPPSEDEVIKNAQGGYYSSDYVHSGNNSLKYSTRWKYAGMYEPGDHMPKLEKKTKYVFSAWIKRDPKDIAPADKEAICVIFRETKGSNVNDTFIGDFKLYNTSEWCQYTKAFETSADFDSTTLCIVAKNPGVEFYVDDIELYKVADFTPKVTSTSIVDNAQNVSTKAIINYELNCPVDTVTYDNVYINDVQAKISDVNISMMDGVNDKPGHEKTFFAIKPTTLQSDTNYKVTLKNVRLATGQILPDYNLNFKTTRKDPANLVTNADSENFAETITAGAECYSRFHKKSGLFSTRAVSGWNYGNTDNIKISGLTSGTTYDYSLWVSLDQAQVDPKKLVFLTRFWYEGATEVTQSWVQAATITNKDGFVNFKGSFTTATQKLDANKQQTIAIVAENTGVAYYFDDIVITPKVKDFEVQNQFTSNAQPIEKLQSGLITSENIITNNTLDSISVKNILAHYDRDGKLKNVVMSDDVQVLGGDMNMASASINISTVPLEGEKINSFIWNSATLVPVCEKKVLANSRKILFVGNSITKHAPKEDIGWYGDYGMAASSKENDYVHQLMKMVNTDNRFDFKVQNIADVEGNHKNIADLQYRNDIKECIEFDPDYIVISLGANVKADIADFNMSYKNIIDMFNPKATAQVIVVTTVLTSNEVLASIDELLMANSYIHIKTEDLGTDDKYLAKGKFENPGIQIHPGDLGMLTMAERIWAKLSFLIG